MPRLKVFLALALLAGNVAVEQSHPGPRCLGPFCVNHADPTRILFKQLGQPAPRVSRYSPYCYQSHDGKTFLHIDTIDSEPEVAGSVFLSDFPNCLHMGITITTDAVGAWVTPEGIRIGSSEDDVLKAYGKPSSMDRITAQAYPSLIRGYRSSDSLPMIPERLLLYDNIAGDDLSTAEFGIRNGKVCYISLSHNE